MLAKISNQKGFSLIELMLVVSILSILGSIASVNYKYYKVKSIMGKYEYELAGIKTVVEGLGSLNGTYPDSGAWSGYISSQPGSPNYVNPATVTDSDIKSILESMPVMDQNLLPSYAFVDRVMTELSPVQEAEACYVGGTRTFVYTGTGNSYKIFIDNLPYYNVMTRMIDPNRDDGGDCNHVDGNEPWAMALYKGPNGACM